MLGLFLSSVSASANSIRTKMAQCPVAADVDIWSSSVGIQYIVPLQWGTYLRLRLHYPINDNNRGDELRITVLGVFYKIAVYCRCIDNISVFINAFMFKNRFRATNMFILIARLILKYSLWLWHLFKHFKRLCPASIKDQPVCLILLFPWQMENIKVSHV